MAVMRAAGLMSAHMAGARTRSVRWGADTDGTPSMRDSMAGASRRSDAWTAHMADDGDTERRSHLDSRDAADADAPPSMRSSMARASRRSDAWAAHMADDGDTERRSHLDSRDTADADAPPSMRGSRPSCTYTRGAGAIEGNLPAAVPLPMPHIQTGVARAFATLSEAERAPEPQVMQVDALSEGVLVVDLLQPLSSSGTPQLTGRTDYDEAIQRDLQQLALELECEAESAAATPQLTNRAEDAKIQRNLQQLTMDLGGAAQMAAAEREAAEREAEIQRDLDDLARRLGPPRRSNRWQHMDQGESGIQRNLEQIPMELGASRAVAAEPEEAVQRPAAKAAAQALARAEAAKAKAAQLKAAAAAAAANANAAKAKGHAVQARGALDA